MDFNLISVYTRDQAIEDGVLVDVTIEARPLGYKMQTCITDHLHGKLNEIEDPEHYKKELSLLLQSAADKVYFALKANKDISLLEFSYCFFKEENNPTKLWVCHTPEEGFTIMFPEDY